MKKKLRLKQVLSKSKKPNPFQKVWNIIWHPANAEAQQLFAATHKLEEVRHDKAFEVGVCAEA